MHSYDFNVFVDLNKCTDSLLCTDMCTIAKLKGSKFAVELSVCGEVSILDRRTGKEYYDASEYPVALIQDIKGHRVYDDKRWETNEVNCFEFCIYKITKNEYDEFFDNIDYGIEDLSKYSYNDLFELMRTLLSDYEEEYYENI